MKKNVFWAAAALAAIAWAPLSASAMPINLSATIEFQDLGNPDNPLPDLFQITNNSDAGAMISSITIDLTGAPNAPVFDTLDGCSPAYCYGAATGAPITEIAGDDVGFVALTPGEQAALEEAQVLTLLFTGFDAGESFLFSTDLDDLVDFYLTGVEMQDVVASVNFTGDSLNASGSANFVRDFPPAGRAVATVVAEVPEPGTLALIGIGLLGVGYFGRTRQRRRWL